MFKRLTAICLTLAASISAHAAVPARAQIDVTGYVIHADLDPVSGTLTSTATVTFTALEDLNAAIFGLNNALQLTSVTDVAATPKPSARLGRGPVSQVSRELPASAGSLTF